MRIKYCIWLLFLVSLTLTQETCTGESCAGDDQLQLDINAVKQRILENPQFDSKAEYYRNLINQLRSSSHEKFNNRCLNGKDKSSLSEKEYLEEFARGPCSPTIMVPGLTTSRLVAHIDCELLKKSDPKLFKTCGWYHCFFPSWVTLFTPKKEYIVWLPPLLSKLSVLRQNEGRRECLAGILGLKVTQDGKSLKIEAKPGIEITAIGEKGDTKTVEEDGECGFAAMQGRVSLGVIDDLIDDFDWVKQHSPGIHYYKYMKESFLNAGYKIGVTLQALPYDWRLDLRKNNLNQKYKNVVDRLFSITGKKVTLISHSFGNYQTANYLWNTPQEVKDKKIARFISIASPYLGAVEPTRTLLGGDDMFVKEILDLELGLTKSFFTGAAFSFQGFYNLLLKKTFSKHKDKSYMKAIQQRMKAEDEKKEQPKGTVMDIFPSPREICSQGFLNRPDKCLFGFQNLLEYGQITGEKVTVNNIKDKLTKFSYSILAGEISEVSRDERFDEMKNFGVQTNIIFSSLIPTDFKVDYQKNPRAEFETNGIYPPDTSIKARGDGDVLVSSAVTPGIKWAEEYLQKQKGAKPVNIIEVCSLYNRRTSIFGPGTLEVKDNAYFGIDCACDGLKKGERRKGESCGNHTNMVSDPHFIDFVLSSSIDNQTGVVGKKWKKMTNKELKEFQANCRLFE